MDIRKLNQWLKQNVPFRAKAVRRSHREVVIGAEVGCDLHAFADAIGREFANQISKVHAYGLSNYVTLIVK